MRVSPPLLCHPYYLHSTSSRNYGIIQINWPNRCIYARYCTQSDATAFNFIENISRCAFSIFPLRYTTKENIFFVTQPKLQPPFVFLFSDSLHGIRSERMSHLLLLIKDIHLNNGISTTFGTGVPDLVRCQPNTYHTQKAVHTSKCDFFK